jgi:hypothetical protein
LREVGVWFLRYTFLCPIAPLNNITLLLTLDKTAR